MKNNVWFFAFLTVFIGNFFLIASFLGSQKITAASFVIDIQDEYLRHKFDSVDARSINVLMEVCEAFGYEYPANTDTYPDKTLE